MKPGEDVRPPASSGSRHPDGHRHPLVRHDVQRPATDTHLGRPLLVPPARHTRTKDRLQAEYRRLGQRSAVVPRLSFPRLAADLTYAAEVLIPGQPGAGGVAVPLDLRIPPRRDYRPGAPAVQRLVHRPAVVRPVG